MPRSTKKVGAAARETMRAMVQLSRGEGRVTYRDLADRLGISPEAAKGRVKVLKLMDLWKWEIALRQEPRVNPGAGDGIRGMVEENRAAIDAGHVGEMVDGRGDRDDPPAGVPAMPARPALPRTTAEVVGAYRREWRAMTGRSRSPRKAASTHGMPAYIPRLHKCHAPRLGGR
jgi:DNA-binding Lrp family transcriptional regulator